MLHHPLTTLLHRNPTDPPTHGTRPDRRTPPHRDRGIRSLSLLGKTAHPNRPSSPAGHHTRRKPRGHGRRHQRSRHPGQGRRPRQGLLSTLLRTHTLLLSSNIHLTLRHLYRQHPRKRHLTRQNTRTRRKQYTSTDNRTLRDLSPPLGTRLPTARNHGRPPDGLIVTTQTVRLRQHVGQGARKRTRHRSIRRLKRLTLTHNRSTYTHLPLTNTPRHQCPLRTHRRLTNSSNPIILSDH